MELASIAANPVPPGGRVEQVVTEDGIRLRCTRWPATGADHKGTVLILQGRIDFIEKYFEAIADLQNRGFAVVAFDWRGQGGSQRLVEGRCHIEGFADYDRDLDAIMRQVVLPDCPPPIFVLAHSMGALVCLRAVHEGRARFTRTVLIAPMLSLSRLSAPPMGMVRFLTGLGLFLGRDLGQAANRALRARDEPMDEPRQQKLSEVLRFAPALRTGRPTIRWVYSAARAMKAVSADDFARTIKPPTLVIAAGRDRIVSNDSIERFSADLPSGAQIVIPGAGHELLLEPDSVREQFWGAFDAFVPGTDPFQSTSVVGEPG